MPYNTITAGTGIIVRQTGVDSAQVALDPSIQSAIDAIRAEIAEEGPDFQAQIDALETAIARIRRGIENAASSPDTDSIPAGLIAMWSGLLSAIPTGWALCDGLNGTPDLRSKFIKGSAAGIDPGVTGGSNTHTHDDHNYTPDGTVSQPTFTGTPNATSSDSAGTPAGTVSAPTFTGTPGATSSDSAGTPSGTCSGGAVDAHSGTAVADHASHTHAVTSNVSVDTHAAHTHSVTSNVSVDNHASHTHTYTEVPNHVHVQNMQSAQTGPLLGWAAGDASTNTPVATGYSTANPTGGVATGTTAGPSATLTHTANNPAVTSGNPSASLTHTVNNPAVTSAGPSITLTHSVTQPSNHVFTQPTFAGNALAAHDHDFTPAGTNSAPSFTGAALAAHDHDFTPTGTVSQPTFTGVLDALAHSVANNEPVFYSLAFIMKL